MPTMAGIRLGTSPRTRACLSTPPSPPCGLGIEKLPPPSWICGGMGCQNDRGRVRRGNGPLELTSTRRQVPNCAPLASRIYHTCMHPTLVLVSALSPGVGWRADRLTPGSDDPHSRGSTAAYPAVLSISSLILLAMAAQGPSKRTSSHGYRLPSYRIAVFPSLPTVGIRKDWAREKPVWRNLSSRFDENPPVIYR